MREINIDVSPQYKVVIDSGLLSNIGEYINKIGKYNRIAIITDDVVSNLYLSQVEDSLKAVCENVYSYAFTNGESSKNFDTLSDILEFLSIREITRTDLVIALGGGVVGDMVGFASSIYLRGVDFVNIPTTLLSMVDSSVGGKTAINTKAGKNMVGSFYQPKVVLCDTNVLSSLSSELIADGVGEIAKYAILEDNGIIADLLSDNITLCLEDVIEKCVIIKNDYVSCDVYDKGKRQLLNLGHTLGHAIEKHSNFSVSHGKAVLMGMYMLAQMFNGTEGIGRILIELEKVGLKYDMPVEYPLSVYELWSLAINDKKRHADYITIARPYDIGDCRLDNVKISNPINFTESVKNQTYDVVVRPVKLCGTIIAPPSKSDLHRLLIASAFSGEITTINNVSFSDDILVTLNALRSLGVVIQIADRSVILQKGILPKKATIDCGECGTALRFFIPICAMLGVETTFTGTRRLGERGYLDIINAMSGDVEFSMKQGLPLSIKGVFDASKISVSGEISSQFISGILLGAFACNSDMDIEITGELQSENYVDMTINTLSKFGCNSNKRGNVVQFSVGKIIHDSNDKNVKVCKSSQIIMNKIDYPSKSANVFQAESDYSNGAFFNVAGVNTVYNNPTSLQGDREIIKIVEEAYKDFQPFDISIKNIPDLGIILAVLATRLNGVSVLRDCARLRHKECDRFEAILQVMKASGVETQVINDDIYITGGNATGDVIIDSLGDHRVAMSVAILASFTDSICIKNASVVNKSYPEFWEDFMKVGGLINVINIR